jgi:hypothetical protein
MGASLLNLRMNFTPKSAGNLFQNWQIKFILKFSAFFNLIFMRSYRPTKFQKNKTIISSRKNKQGSIGKKINPMLPCLFFRLDIMVLVF